MNKKASSSQQLLFPMFPRYLHRVCLEDKQIASHLRNESFQRKCRVLPFGPSFVVKNVSNLYPNIRGLPFVPWNPSREKVFVFLLFLSFLYLFPFPFSFFCFPSSSATKQNKKNKKGNCFFFSLMNTFFFFYVFGEPLVLMGILCFFFSC